MKKAILNLVAGAYITGIILTGCKSPAEKTGNEKDMVQEATRNTAEGRLGLTQHIKDSFATKKSDFFAEFRAFQKESENKINQNEEQITEIQTNIERGMINYLYLKPILTLKLRNNAMKRRITEYKELGKEDLEAFKQRFNTDIDEIKKSIASIK